MNMRCLIKSAFIVLFLGVLFGCGGGGGSSREVERIQPPSPADLELDYKPTKTLAFTWEDQTAANHYRIYESADGVSEFVEIADVANGVEKFEHVVPLYARLNAKYRLDTCYDNACSESDVVTIDPIRLSEAVGVFKASNSKRKDRFGTDVALSDDGLIMAISAHTENTAASESGGVYIFAFQDGGWIEETLIKSKAPSINDYFGVSISLSGNGKVLAIGAKGDDSSIGGVNPSEKDSAESNSGAVYIYESDLNGSWLQKAFIKADSPKEEDLFGDYVWLSADGSTLAVSAPSEDYSTGGINTLDPLLGEPGDDYGAVYIYKNEGGDWSKQAYIKPSSPEKLGYFGQSIELSGDGSVLAVGSGFVDYSRRASLIGRLYVFSRDSSGSWVQENFYVDNNLRPIRVAINRQGNKIAVYSWSKFNQGAVFLYYRNQQGWNFETQFDVEHNPIQGNGGYGSEIQFSGNGELLVIGEVEDSACKADVSGVLSFDCPGSGSVIVYKKGKEQKWIKVGLLKGKSVDSADFFGRRFAIDFTGKVIAVAAFGVDSSGTGINPENTSIGLQNSGAVFLY